MIDGWPEVFAEEFEQPPLVFITDESMKVLVTRPFYHPENLWLSCRRVQRLGIFERSPSIFGTGDQ